MTFCAAHNPVGAGLPAMASCQSTEMPAVPLQSRASSLPQGSALFSGQQRAGGCGKMPVTQNQQGLPRSMSEKDTIAVQLVREALLQSCAPGVAREELLSKVGIAPALLETGEGRVPASQYAKLWRLLARRGDDEFFGMDPRKLKSGSLAFLCRSAMAQPSLAAGLSTGLSFLSLMLERLPAQLVHQQSLAEIVLLEDDPEPRRAFTYFTYWMIVHGVACWLAGRRIPILAIELRCPAPDFIDDYRVMFSDNLRFDRPRTRMIFSADCLDLPIKRSAEELKRFLAHAPANILVKYRDPQSLASRIKHDLRQLPAEQWPETEALAQQLCMSASTLRRRLAEEGQTYQGLKDSVRKELAIVWLAEPSISFVEIASRLGFADASSFYKAFRKWSGSNPGHYRTLILNEAV
ncbi:hypothetical protein PS732_01470 [Pseudomonas fluorescens]|uniref:HTH araC/xylS-type domain-containing protein n=2 Tax=Pseudomonas fluorescens TaxID=294 RepID=A0ABD7VCG3_PSEFL|nr:hypothetical protein PS732_01470 [Pseudomonas fluorescens]